MIQTIGQESQSKSNFDYLVNHLDSLPIELQSQIYTQLIKKLSV